MPTQPKSMRVPKRKWPCNHTVAGLIPLSGRLNLCVEVKRSTWPTLISTTVLQGPQLQLRLLRTGRGCAGQLLGVSACNPVNVSRVRPKKKTDVPALLPEMCSG